MMVGTVLGWGRNGMIVLTALLLAAGGSAAPPADGGGCVPGTIITVAGGGKPGDAGDGGPATKANLIHPRGLAVGADGSVYIADNLASTIRKVDPAGIISTVAGNGKHGHAGDGGPARNAGLNVPWGLCLGPDGSLYVADGGRVRRVDPKGIITTVAGDGRDLGLDEEEGRGTGDVGDGKRATDVGLNYATGVAVSADGTIYIADMLDHRVRKVDVNGVITTVAGTGEAGYGGDGGPASRARLCAPIGIGLGPDGSLYIADAYNGRVRKMDREGIITTVAGTGQKEIAPPGDGGPATKGRLGMPEGVAVGADGSLYIADYDFAQVRKVDPAGIITTLAGLSWARADGKPQFAGDGGPAAEGMLSAAAAVAVAMDGSVYIADNVQQPRSQGLRGTGRAGLVSGLPRATHLQADVGS